MGKERGGRDREVSGKGREARRERGVVVGSERGGGKERGKGQREMGWGGEILNTVIAQSTNQLSGRNTSHQVTSKCPDPLSTSYAPLKPKKALPM